MQEKTAQKAALRRELLANRQAIPTEVRRRADALIGTHVLAWHKMHPVGSMGVYWPIRGEPDLLECYAALSALGVRLALPIVVDKHSPLRFLTWKPGDAMTKDSLGVAIPVAGDEVQPEALLVPCVGFNDARFRLGYGGGFYDRTLERAPRPLTVGIAYECARSRFDADAHDVALDYLVTEKETPA
ncbi:5-formyltetrahydrofolate cyclo-ligase [Noviherbaspirillum denitrificans]|uniref:5-formyltetrahydrofolate cyclo-ligase n=1 Tax=Noviherbaspirillum denitrificans TaxID=1968433 RepID=A0A254TE45_9BURK|nr:5-formyltetrahydrofolate cyclo-ligase [Noviherbaspirillum denitrificans]OWW18813.1 5-formyltetrahydrofolate cyclo-ligase [Noviherbaspirillum denitrificans]